MGKSIFKKYSEYLADNPEGYWFRRKVYGWGWIPANSKGWLSTFGFILLILYLGVDLASGGEPSSRDLVIFYGKLFLAIVLIIFVCYKTGEKPKWSWGFKDE